MPNRLAESRSLYLRKHAENPIDWWPWCDEALTKARQDNRPIFLSIGYSSCHWCTVMEGEAFSDSAIAAYLNAHFVPIKVDREERPDLDSIYMQALQMMTGQGGWPLNVVLAPEDLVPFYGGTYFPVEPKYGRPGFLQVLQALHQFYETEGEKVGLVKAEILDNLQRSAQLADGETLTEAVLARGLGLSAQILTPVDYGNCFPMMPYAIAALRGDRLGITGEQLPDIRQTCAQRGRALALGGIFDHVAGGFHRYTVDPTWTVPHFEKMLYDNGQVMEYLAELWSAGIQEPSFERAIAHTVDWLTREMTAPEGYFYAAQDADSFTTAAATEPEEGAFYVWAYDDLKALLPEPELAALAAAFHLSPGGNFEGRIVLQRQATAIALSPEVEAALDRLFYQRYGATRADLAQFPPALNQADARSQPWPGRIPPVTDIKMIVAWNSLMISGLARAAAVLQEPRYFDLAARAAQFILTHQWRDDRLHRLNYDGTPAVPAQSEDYANFIKALLDLDQAAIALPEAAISIHQDWRQHAIAVQQEFDHWLWSEDQGGYFNTATDASDDLLVRERSYQDNATPSANGIAIANLVRLFLLTETLAYLDRAERGLHAFSSVMARQPRACPSLFVALDWFRHGTLVRAARPQLAVIARQYLPTACLTVADLPDGVVGMVCEGLFCKAPAHSVEQLQEQLYLSQRRTLPPA